MQKNQNDTIFIEITITNSCNCNCKYCFEPNHNNTSSIEEENLQISRLIELCEEIKNTERKLVLSFWGGEPMVNKDFLFKIVKSTYVYDFVSYQMYTNGTLVDNFKEMISQKWFDEIKNRFHIQISYDGEPHHSLMRCYDTKNVFEVVDLLIEKGIKPSFKATISLNNIKLLPQIWLSYYDLFKKYDYIDYCPTLDTTDDDINYIEDWETSLREVIKYEHSFIKKYGRPLWFWFRDNEKISCSISNRLHIHNDGNMYICHGCPYINDNLKFILGNTKENKISDCISERIIDVNETCLKCDATYCSVCHINNMINEKNFNEVYDNWTKCRHINENKCKYFKVFAKYSRILKNSTVKR